ncbi:Sugar transferase [Candidatus Methylopumilus planktonicus]|jgi:O-antigen biosynthesis protein WbqP|uniref:Sugar transferase n=1 Tax=Candidatus Methylopumilus planktonicus TaxID=1581557 RepID=A0A0D6EWG7_9PROT|nr:sugar transferase [Candidatus Methylopumilus planktonicus]CEZ19816.1 Sugar transferase [Candidatus Methylopumilus planktonicus]
MMHLSINKKRFFDLALVFFAIILFLIPFISLCIAVRLSSKGPALYWSDRVGLENKIFKMPKFRTMRIETPNVATHLLDNPTFFYTPIGSFLRKSSFDEIPQLWSILLGHMSFVGPRPALFNQYDLIQLRSKAGVSRLLPGLTGWAQVNGRDHLSIMQKVNLDVEYLNRKSFRFDLYILWITFLKVIGQDGISH